MSHHGAPNYHIPAQEVQRTKAGVRGVKGKGNAGAMGDPVSDQSQHNYQVSRDTDMDQHADDAARRKEEIDEARANMMHDV
jgi:hypothetical protein